MKGHCKFDRIYFSPPRFCPDGQLLFWFVFQINIPHTKQHICKPHLAHPNPSLQKSCLFALAPTVFTYICCFTIMTILKFNRTLFEFIRTHIYILKPMTLHLLLAVKFVRLQEIEKIISQLCKCATEQ